MQRPRFKVRVRVTPLTPYRFALGVWTSINPNEARNRLAILEVDDDAFRLTYTVFLGVGHQHIQLPMSRPNAGETYSIELEIQESPNMAHARVYDRENRLLCEQRSDGLGLPYASDDVFVGVAVWTDDVSCPLSSYEIEDLEIV